MSGRLNGVQAKFSETNQCALYIHCHAHRLNLVIVDVAHEVKCASEFFALVESLYLFLTRHKVHEVFVSLQVKYGAVVRELGRLSDTRWACRYRNLAVLDERIGIVIEVLHQVQETCDADNVVHARGLLSQVQTVQFVACLKIFYRILSLFHGVSKTMQSSTLNIAQSETLIVSMVSALTDLRENAWSDIWQEIHSLCDMHEIAVECNRGDKSSSAKRRRVAKSDSMHLYYECTGNRLSTFAEPFDALRVDVFLPVLDRIINEMNRRFSTQSLAIMCSLQSLLCPTSDKFFKFASLTPFLSHYGDKCKVNSSLLKAELLIASEMIKKHREDLIKKAKPGTSITLDLASIIKLLSQNWSALGNLLKCIQIAMTIPVTSASCERSFSAMKLVKPCLRNRSGDQRLSDLVTLFTCKDRELDREEIIESTRRVQFI